MATCETNGHLWGIDHRCIFCKTINLEPIPQSMQERELTAYQIAKDNLELKLINEFGQQGRAVVGPWHTRPESWQVY